MKNYGGRSSVGRVPDCDSGRRGFEPHRPPHTSMRTLVLNKVKSAWFLKWVLFGRAEDFISSVLGLTTLKTHR